MPRDEQRDHAVTLLDFSRIFQPALNRLSMTQEAFKAQRAAAVLETMLEELVEALR